MVLFGQVEIHLISALLTYCVPFIVFILGNRPGIKTKSKGE